MELEGKIRKYKQQWLVEVSSLDVMTQGRTRKEAISMIQEVIIDLIMCYFEDEVLEGFDITVIDYKRSTLGISATDNKLLLAFSLIRQREKSKSTIREASARLGSSSPNAYAQYEKGKTNISLEKYEQLLFAANPNQHSHLRLVQ